MSEIARLILENFTTLCLIIGLGIITIINKNLDDRTNRSFIAFVGIVLLLMIADIFDLYLSNLPYLSPARYITSSLGYTLPSTGVAIIIGILLRRKKSSVILWVPIMILGVLSFTSCFTKVMFWFNETNNFMRGPLGYLPHIVSGVYLAVLIVLTIKMHRYITSGEVFAVLFIAAISILAVVLESVLTGYKFLLPGSMITSCAIYYIVLYVETYRRDPLTGLMNRKSFYIDAKRMKNRAMAVISVDLNGLKSINDSFGHSEGDKALQKLSDAMLNCGGKKFCAYRTGGDEFMALGFRQTEADVKKYTDSIRETLAVVGLMASFGYAPYAPNDNFDEVCEAADVKMYDDKMNYRHRATSTEIAEENTSTGAENGVADTENTDTANVLDNKDKEKSATDNSATDEDKDTDKK